MYSNFSFSSSIFIKQSLINSTSSLSPYVLLPWCHILCLFLLYRKARAHLPLLFKSTWARHLHVPVKRLLVEDRLQARVIASVITKEAGALVGGLLRLRLVAGGLRGCSSRVFLLTWCKRVEVWIKCVGWTSIFGTTGFPLRQECLPPWRPLCHLRPEEADTANRKDERSVVVLKDHHLFTWSPLMWILVYLFFYHISSNLKFLI